MKYRIEFSNGWWHVIEPSGEVRWYFRTWDEAIDCVRRRNAAGQ